MDFFEHQQRARTRTGMLVFLYLLAVAGVIAGVYSVILAAFMGAKHGFWQPDLLVTISGFVLIIVCLGTLYKVWMLSSGGRAVAEAAGGSLIDVNTRDPKLRRLLNVVEEMSLASGLSVPDVYLREGERSINAFAAGYRPNQAVVAVTAGTLEYLNRDELQGVVAHEFSHILSGDMRLNIRLIGILHGILLIALIGYFLMRSVSGGRSSSRDAKGQAAMFFIGLALYVVGYIGVFFGALIKSAVSRQREFLADASAVQFTRNPAGIANALKKIGGLDQQGRLETHAVHEVSHMCFANGLREAWFSLFSTHPPLIERIRRIDPYFRAAFSPPQPAIEEEAQNAQASGFAPAAKQADTGWERPTSLRPAISSQAVLNSVGQLSSAAILQAREIYAGLPPLLAQLRSTSRGACLILYSLALSVDGAEAQKQFELIAPELKAQEKSEIYEIRKALQALGPRYRLPLVELSLPALRLLGKQQYLTLKENLRKLTEFDQQINLFEFALLEVVHFGLAPLFGQSERLGQQNKKLCDLLPACQVLLSILACHGSKESAKNDQAYEQGRLELGLNTPRLAAQGLTLRKLHEALIMLRLAVPLVKRQIIKACSSCILADREVTLEEGELLRTVCLVLECPMPPLEALES